MTCLRFAVLLKIEEIRCLGREAIVEVPIGMYELAVRTSTRISATPVAAHLAAVQGGYGLANLVFGVPM